MSAMRTGIRHNERGFMIVESLVAFAIFASVSVAAFTYLNRMDANLARVRVEAHLGMLCNQYQELFGNVPWDALQEAAGAPEEQGYILFNGGSRRETDVPYRTEVGITYSGVAANPASQRAQIVVDVYWSPPSATDQTSLVPTPGNEVEFRRLVINRSRY